MKIIVISIFLLVAIFILLSSEKETYDESQGSFITFIIPSIGRETLAQTLKSLQKQNYPDWKAIVVFDGKKVPIPKDLPFDDKRIDYIRLDKKAGRSYNSAGNVRNKAIPYINSKWVGFVDDDDSITPNYINNLLEESKMNLSSSCIVFRMYNGNKLIPSPNTKNLVINDVGISYALKADIFSKYKFIPSKQEDFYHLLRLYKNNQKITLSDKLSYQVDNSKLPKTLPPLTHVNNIKVRHSEKFSEQRSLLRTFFNNSHIRF